MIYHCDEHDTDYYADEDEGCPHCAIEEVEL
jgi:hypothetical protein